MANTCTIGDFTFELAPEREIDISSGRDIAKIDVPGGAPRYQDVGPSEKIASWSGLLRGDEAYKQTLLIEEEKDKGTWLRWRYGEIAADVRIKSFNKKIIRFDYIRYTIELIVKVSSPVVDDGSGSETVEEPQIAAADTEAKEYVVKQGDTLWQIGQENGVDWETIASANGITNPRKLAIGQKLTIPV
ncbi:LysM peptidoglycan-binding domain-containing protein [Paenibacillus naphthalenovorans]|uniref:LysM peptidoglycan-binding domain-containing protein n=1 Tax=Paenibacillus naphthalenovorans TaxID=162209 RepID=UPI00087E7414|nr:LysM peptidoglycan-binding domain-containing protein [Paenibacillus naphthalenovorans]SDI49045.1 LysM repeat-containing protein [Paenibacillus naphthalenovorans]